MMMHRIALPAVALAACLVTACAGTKRNTAMYRADTQRVLETRNADIKRCYDKVLASDPSATGTVTVRFVVEKKTGAFTKVSVDPNTSNAKEPLTMCVLEAVNGLRLDPPDMSSAQATFSYQLAPSVATAPM